MKGENRDERINGDERGELGWKSKWRWKGRIGMKGKNEDERVDKDVTGQRIEEVNLLILLSGGFAWRRGSSSSKPTGLFLPISTS